MKILLAGGTGLIGTALLDYLSAQGHLISLLTRQEVAFEGGIQYQWDGREVPELDQHFDVIINLCGASISKGPWTSGYKKKLVQSRVKSTQALVDYIRRADVRPSIFINASASGIYGSHADAEVTESTPSDYGFLPELVKSWERAAEPLQELGVRTVFLRTGVVLARDGGPLPKLVMPLKLRMLCVFGSGKQFVPWVHVSDVVGVINFCMMNNEMLGPINVASPISATMQTIIDTIAKELKPLLKIRIPAVFLRLLLGKRAFLLLQSQKLVPAKLIEKGYVFKYPTIKESIKSLVLD